MAWETPTAAEFKVRYPEFISVDNGRVDMYLALAAEGVSQSWTELDYREGIMALAAHQMSMEGEPQGGGGFITTRAVTKRVVGDVAVSYADPRNGNAVWEYYALSVYGMTYVRLMRLNTPAIAAV